MNYIKNLMTDVENAESNRLSAMLFMFLVHGCITTPLTIFSMYLVGQPNDIQFFVCVLLSMLVVVTNLAVMPTKITVPLFSFSTLVFIAMIIYNVIAYVLV